MSVDSSSSAQAPDVSIWCHICGIECTGFVNTLTSEYNCRICSSECVEELSQGIETFNVPAPQSSASSSSLSPSGSTVTPNSTPQDMNDVMNQFISQLLVDGSAAIPSSTPSVAAPLGSPGNSNPNGLTTTHLQRPGMNVTITSRSVVAPANLTTLLNNATGGVGTANTTLPGGVRVVPLANGALAFGVSRSGGGVGLPFGSLNSLFGRGDPAGLFSQIDAEGEDSTFARIMHQILMNENSHVGAPPVNEDVLTRLTKVTTTQENLIKDECCNISQESFEVGDVVVSLPCEHKYKEENIVHWLKMHNTCPVCRIEIV